MAEDRYGAPGDLGVWEEAAKSVLLHMLDAQKLLAPPHPVEVDASGDDGERRSARSDYTFKNRHISRIVDAQVHL